MPGSNADFDAHATHHIKDIDARRFPLSPKPLNAKHWALSIKTHPLIRICKVPSLSRNFNMEEADTLLLSSLAPCLSLITSTLPTLSTLQSLLSLNLLYPVVSAALSILDGGEVEQLPKTTSKKHRACAKIADRVKGESSHGPCPPSTGITFSPSYCVVSNPPPTLCTEPSIRF